MNRKRPYESSGPRPTVENDPTEVEKRRKRPTWTASKGDLVLKVFREPFARVPTAAEFQFEDLFTSRSLFFVVEATERRRMAAGHFREWRINYHEEYLADLAAFQAVTDSDSINTVPLGACVAHAWGTGEEEE